MAIVGRQWRVSGGHGSHICCIGQTEPHRTDTVSPISLMLKQMREASAAAAAESSHSGHCVGVQLSGRLQLQNC
jgi:hypothetical protein